MIRDDIKAALVQSMKARNEARTSAIRLIQAAIKNKDIELRTGGGPADDDALIIDVLQKMAKQRRESIEMFDKGGRAELAEAERAELAVIEGFLPAQMDEAEARRSEEHTSELQSLMRISYAVFCLKKQQYTNKK